MKAGSKLPSPLLPLVRLRAAVIIPGARWARQPERESEACRGARAWRTAASHACRLLLSSAAPPGRCTCCVCLCLSVCVCVCVLAAVERDMLEEDGGELANIDEDEPCPEPIILSVSCLLCAAIAWLCLPVSVQLFTLTSLHSHVSLLSRLFTLTSLYSHVSLLSRHRHLHALCSYVIVARVFSLSPTRLLLSSFSSVVVVVHTHTQRERERERERAREREREMNIHMKIHIHVYVYV